MNALLALLRNLLHNMLQLFSFGRKTITNTLSVCIKTNTGNTLNVDLDPLWDIGNVKRLVAGELGLCADDLKIIFAGKELSNSTTIAECDLGQRSVLHAVRARHSPSSSPSTTTSASTASGSRRPALQAPSASSIAEEPDDADEELHHPASKPLAATLVDLQLIDRDRLNIGEAQRERTRAHFFVHCSQCRQLCAGKLRVRCAVCGGGAFTVYRDPECWEDVLRARRIHGLCETAPDGEQPCVDAGTAGGPPYAEFYFKCAVHESGGERDFSAPLSLIKINIRDVPCLACTDVHEQVLVFPCSAGHVTCLPCFRRYCETRLLERQFVEHPEAGYTLACPAGCADSAIVEVHHFKLLSAEQYERYQRFATEEFVLRSGGVLCPQPGCGMGLLVDEGCTRVQCQQGCGVSVVFACFIVILSTHHNCVSTLSFLTPVRLLSPLPEGLPSRRMRTRRSECRRTVNWNRLRRRSATGGNGTLGRGDGRHDQSDHETLSKMSHANGALGRLHAHGVHTRRMRSGMVLGVPDRVDTRLYGSALVWIVAKEGWSTLFLGCVNMFRCIYFVYITATMCSSYKNDKKSIFFV